jgi:hypothetical protein
MTAYWLLADCFALIIVVVTELTETAFARCRAPCLTHVNKQATTPENQLLFCFPLFNC